MGVAWGQSPGFHRLFHYPGGSPGLGARLSRALGLVGARRYGCDVHGQAVELAFGLFSGVRRWRYRAFAQIGPVRSLSS